MVSPDQKKYNPVEKTQNGVLMDPNQFFDRDCCCDKTLINQIFGQISF
jgi:hypothetical protein